MLKKYISLKTILGVIFILQISVTILAQYSSDPSINLSITQNGQIRNSIVSSSGNLYCLYYKNGSLYIKILDENGFPVIENGELEIGLMDSNADTEYSHASIELDINGNAYVAYMIPNNGIRFTKISSTGTILYYKDFIEGYYPVVYKFSNQNLMVTYTDLDKDSTTYEYMTDSGSGFTVNWSKTFQFNNESVLEKSDGNLYLVSYEMLFVPPYGYVYANMMDINTGNLLWSNWTHCFQTETYVLDVYRLKASIDRNDNLYIFKAFPVFGVHIPRIQKINSSGAVQWGSDGEMLLQPAPSSNVNSIFSIYDEINDKFYILISADNNSFHGYIYYKILAADGSTNNMAGIPIKEETNVPSYYLIGMENCGDEGDIVYTYIDGLDNHIFMNKINVSGSNVWNTPLLVNNTTSTKGHVPSYFKKTDNNQLIVSFQDNRSSGGNGYAQKIDCNGSFASIDETEKEDKFSLYPNPSDGKFVITGDFSSNDLEIRITNIEGKEVSFNSQINSRQISIDLNGDHGIYFVEIKNSNNQTQVLKYYKL